MKLFLPASAGTTCYIHRSVILLSMTISFFHTNHLLSHSFTITLPTSKADYQELASLLVQSFDEPTILNKNNYTSLINSVGDDYVDDEIIQESIKPIIQKQFDQITWSLYDKCLTEQYTFRQYVQNARKMKGKKYALYLAKEYNPGTSINSDIDTPRPFYETIGLIEVGMVLEPNRITNDNDSGNSSKGSGGGSGSVSILRARPTVGILCVKPDHMKKGVGKALLTKIEQVVSEIWNETQLFIEVEPINERALRFFNSNGYEICLDSFGKEIIQIANVSRRRKMEERPHFVMSKMLKSLE